jgi:hypothetical protein
MDPPADVVMQDPLDHEEIKEIRLTESPWKDIRVPKGDQVSQEMLDFQGRLDQKGQPENQDCQDKMGHRGLRVDQGPLEGVDREIQVFQELRDTPVFLEIQEGTELMESRGRLVGMV